MKSFVLAGCLALALAGCASSPDYRRASGPASPGYREQVIDTNRYRIEYRLNANHAGKAQDYALLRAAELTLQKGYATFDVVSRSSDLNTAERPYTSFGMERDVAFTRTCGLLACRTTATPVYTNTHAHFGTPARETFAVVSFEIVMSNKPADGASNTYDAASVVRHIPRA